MQTKSLLKDKYQILETFNPSLLKQLKLVTKMSLWVGLIALCCLSLMLFTLMPKLPDQYMAFTQLTIQVQNNLLLMLTLSGLLLLIGASFTTWFICLYSSFRISGPLYCFSRNLEQQTKDHPYAQIILRESDSLQEECRLYNETMSKWDHFYRDINHNIAIIYQHLKNPKLQGTDQLTESVEKINRLISKIKYRE